MRTNKWSFEKKVYNFFFLSNVFADRSNDHIFFDRKKKEMLKKNTIMIYNTMNTQFEI